jgi:uncharacterized tellurite resistance protein B-like protein
MNYSSKEKEAINYFLVKLMKIDGHTKLSEAAILYEISNRIGINVNEAEESLSLSGQEAKQIIALMNTEQKEEVLGLFKQMAKVDGIDDPMENSLIAEVFA